MRLIKNILNNFAAIYESIVKIVIFYLKSFQIILIFALSILNKESITGDTCKRVLSSLLLLTLFIVYQVSITMFTHVHYVNGVMVVHSHPSHGKHTHSKIEVVIIARLSSFHSLEADAPIHIEAIRPLLYCLQQQTDIPVMPETHMRVVSLRAPPVVRIG